jgi:actin related protein 2/3 complex subunit 3
MPSYHSIFNEIQYPTACGIPLIEFKFNKLPDIDPSKLKSSLSEIDLDIIDESLIYFRANVLFKNFPIRGDADKLLVYITVYIQKCLEVVSSCKEDLEQIKLQLRYLIDEAEWTPNLKSHFFNNVITIKNNEVSELQSYLKTVRRETCSRLLAILFEGDQKAPDYKYWLGFSKRKFLGYEMITIKK